MIKEKRSRKKKWKIRLYVFLIVAMLLAVGALVVIKVFTVKNVVVTGNEYYPENIIEDFVLNDEFSWNTLYVYFKYCFQEPEDIPFVDTMEITMKIPHTIQIKVYEKGLLGYVYLDSVGQNAYFDKDGFVVETSSEAIEGVPQITGLPVEKVVLYEKLPIKSKSVLKTLLSLTQMLKKYELAPEAIHYGDDKSYTLEWEKIKVLLGQADNLNDKVLRLSYIMPSLEGLGGTLHLEGWTENTTDIPFEKSE